MYNRLVVLTVLILSLHSKVLVSGGKTSYHDLSETLKNKVQDILKQHEANVSKTIQLELDYALQQLNGIPDYCKQQAKGKFEDLKLWYENTLSESCSLRDRLKDQFDVVEADLELVMKTIIGNGVDIIYKADTCLGSEDRFKCIFTDIIPDIFSALMNDFGVTLNSLYQVIKLVVEGADVIWTCLDRCFFTSSLNNILKDAARCSNPDL